MKKPNPTPKARPQAKPQIPAEPEAPNFSDTMRRIVRVQPQDVKRPKR